METTGIVTYYRFLDYFGGVYQKCKVEIRSFKDAGKTAIIKLIECGPNGARPGTEMRVHKKSLEYFKQQK